MINTATTKVLRRNRLWTTKTCSEPAHLLGLVRFFAFSLTRYRDFVESIIWRTAKPQTSLRMRRLVWIVAVRIKNCFPRVWEILAYDSWQKLLHAEKVCKQSPENMTYQTCHKNVYFIYFIPRHAGIIYQVSKYNHVSETVCNQLTENKSTL